MKHHPGATVKSSRRTIPSSVNGGSALSNQSIPLAARQPLHLGHHLPSGLDCIQCIHFAYRTLGLQRGMKIKLIHPYALERHSDFFFFSQSMSTCLSNRLHCQGRKPVGDPQFVRTRQCRRESLWHDLETYTVGIVLWKTRCEKFRTNKHHFLARIHPSSDGQPTSLELGLLEELLGQRCITVLLTLLRAFLFNSP